jgi:putative nucleotidyltransferase with HDIG domain
LRETLKAHSPEADDRDVRQDPERPTRAFVAAQLALLGGAIALAVATAPQADWDPVLLGLLLAFSVASDLLGAELKRARVKLSGSFLALVLAMVLLGGAPAAVIGTATILIGWLRWREEPHNLRNNLVVYATFPLVTGLAFDAVRDAYSLGTNDASLYLLVFGAFVVGLVLNFVGCVGYVAYREGTALLDKVRTVLVPVLPSELFAAQLAAGITYLELRWGAALIALFGIVLLTHQHLVGALLVSEERAEQLEIRTQQLASAQVGLLSALLHSLDLRDRMTARHSAAVARYAREIARAAGLPEREQDLVHTAGLLHDIGKFVLPDRILKANERLSDEDWALIKTHPAEGAMIVSQVEGYGDVADIILAHHERLDGRGYPRELPEEEIPTLARIISIADTYDVMTARDSYRNPVSSEDAIAELRRVSGSQLDGRFVEVFVEVLRARDLRYRHGEDADFDAEISLEKHFAPVPEAVAAGAPALAAA